MSEYQYYEFQAIDRPLSEGDRQALRNLSTRAQITATSFTNSYEWGDFKGDPGQLMEKWFDLHLYLANWGSRRLMIRWPEPLIDRQALLAFLGEVDCVRQRVAGGNLILDISPDPFEGEDWDGGSGWLAALAPLRGDVLAGDLRLFYLLWLTAVEADVFDPDEPELLPGIGPMTGALQAFVDLFQIDRDLVAAAAERPFDATVGDASEARSVIAGITDEAKVDLLMRLVEGDAHVANELKALVRQSRASKTTPFAARTVGELRARAAELRQARERARLARLKAEATQRAEAAERARRARLAEVEQRGESAWREVETEIGRGHATAYDRAATLLSDLKTIAEESGAAQDFRSRLHAIRTRYARKTRFIARLEALG